MSTTTIEDRTQQRRSRVPWTTDLATAWAAVVCALVLWVATAALGGVDLEVRTGDTLRQVGGVAVAVAAAVGGLLGIVLLRLLERTTSRALTIWTVVAVVGALVSLLGPLGATTTSAMGTLVAMHAIVAVVLLAGAHRSRAAWARA